MKVIIHTSKSKFGNAALIDYWHRNPPNNYNRIGYNLVILNGYLDNSTDFIKFYDGLIETGRRFGTTGAHCKGHNKSIGICLIGEPGNYSMRQLKSLDQSLLILREMYTDIEVFQHSDFDDEKPYCAGLDEGYMERLQELVE